MKGTVRIFNVVRGLGFVDGEDGREYFVHFTDIISGVEDEAGHLDVLLPGWTVEFEVVSATKGLQAREVRPSLDDLMAVSVKPILDLDLGRSGKATIAIGEDGNPTISGATADFILEAPGYFCAYFLGQQKLESFEVKLPEPTPERAYLIIDRNKHPVERKEGYSNTFRGVPTGSYLMAVAVDGRVLVWNLGRRYDPRSQENWLVVEKRYEYPYEGLMTATDEGLLKQTPVSKPKKDRDNDGFVPGIRRGINLIAAAR